MGGSNDHGIARAAGMSRTRGEPSYTENWSGALRHDEFIVNRAEQQILPVAHRETIRIGQ